MYVRLAFAVAAHLESEILIVDEVLAVGDAEFQKKCLGKMGEVSKGEGRTVLFVSHNMAAVNQFCHAGIFLDNGSLVEHGAIQKVMNAYLNMCSSSVGNFKFKADSNKTAYVLGIEFLNQDNQVVTKIETGKSWSARVELKINEPITNFVVGLGMLDTNDRSIRTTWTQQIDLDAGLYIFTFKESQIIFRSGNYRFVIGLSRGKENIQYIDENIIIEFEDLGFYSEPNIVDRMNSNILNSMDYEISSKFN